MSAIGSYVVLRRDAFEECVRLAGEIREETSGKWVFKTQVTKGLDEFNTAWKDARVEEVVFDYSGYVLGNYMMAQTEMNGIDTDRFERTPAATALAKAFTAAFPFESSPPDLPPLPQDKLLAFCRDEYGDDDAEGMVQAIMAAHDFFRTGLARVSDSTVAVFLIQ